MSQSLRKSGQFLLVCVLAGSAHTGLGRNPFVNQVSFFRGIPPRRKPPRRKRRNPFVNQVSFFLPISNVEQEKPRVAIPS